MTPEEKQKIFEHLIELFLYHSHAHDLIQKNFKKYLDAMPEESEMDFSPPSLVVKTMVPGDVIARYADNSYGLETENLVTKRKIEEYCADVFGQEPYTIHNLLNWLDREER